MREKVLIVGHEYKRVRYRGGILIEGAYAKGEKGRVEKLIEPCCRLGTYQSRRVWSGEETVGGA